MNQVSYSRRETKRVFREICLVVHTVFRSNAQSPNLFLKFCFWRISLSSYYYDPTTVLNGGLYSFTRERLWNSSKYWLLQPHRRQSTTWLFELSWRTPRTWFFSICKWWHHLWVYVHIRHICSFEYEGLCARRIAITTIARPVPVISTERGGNSLSSWQFPAIISDTSSYVVCRDFPFH